jgi:hypothetical protein
MYHSSEGQCHRIEFTYNPQILHGASQGCVLTNNLTVHYTVPITTTKALYICSS